MAGSIRSSEIADVWRRWKVQQFALCKTLHCRRAVVELLDGGIVGHEASVPEHVATALDDLQTLDRMLPPDAVPEMHPQFVEQHYFELLHELDRRRVLEQTRAARRTTSRRTG